MSGLTKSGKVHFIVQLTHHNALIAEPRSPAHAEAIRALYAETYGKVLPSDKPLILLYRKSEISAFLRLLPYQSARRVKDGYQVIAPVKEEAFLRAFGL